ncbi:MAG: PIN domain-containing protein [Patescibacteria group bacterium]
MESLPPSPIPDIYKNPVQRRPAGPRPPAGPRKPITIPRKPSGFIADGKLHVVLDTTIIIGALPTQNGIQEPGSGAACKKVIEVWRNGGFSLGLNALLMDEYRRVGERIITEGKLVSQPFNSLMEVLQKDAYCFRMVATKQHIAPTYKDDHLFDGIQAEYLVSDDKGVIKAALQKNYKKILSSTDFVTELIRLGIGKIK